MDENSLTQQNQFKIKLTLMRKLIPAHRVIRWKERGVKEEEFYQLL